MAKRYEKLSLGDWRKSRSSNASKVLDTKLCNFYVSSPVEFSYIEKTSYPDKMEATIIQTDIAMLFNQQRLDKMTSSALVEYLDQTTNWRKQGNIGKYSPEQLSMFVKSRYCQSPSELMAWSEYLDANYDRLSAEMQSMLDEQKQQSQLNKPEDTPALSPAPSD